MFKEGRLPWWSRITSAVVVGALLAGCGGRTQGYVTPTPESATPTPMSDPYCDTHIFIHQPELNLDSYDPNEFTAFNNEILAGPTGVGEIEYARLNANPNPGYVQKVRESIKEQDLPINPETAGVYQFGMKGSEGETCAPLTVVTGEPQPDGSQKSYVAFETEQIDADQNGVPDLDVIIPPFDGDIDLFMEMGVYLYNDGSGKRVLGPIDKLDPLGITPLFVIEGNGDISFAPPFYQGPSAEPKNVPIEAAANFVQVSYNPNTNGTEITATPGNTQVGPTETPRATQTPEAAPFQSCQIEQYKDCVINAEDLFNGKYLEWLNTLSKPFDTSKFSKAPLIYYDNGELTYQKTSAPNFNAPGSQPFRRDVTAGFTTYQGHNYIVMPIEFYNPTHPDQSVWLITVANMDGMSDAQVQEQIAIWRNDMAVTLIGDSDTSRFSSTPDPLITRTMQLYPNAHDLLNDFVDFGFGGQRPGNREVINNLKGFVLPNYIVQNSAGWYK